MLSCYNMIPAYHIFHLKTFVIVPSTCGGGVSIAGRGIKTSTMLLFMQLALGSSVTSVSILPLGFGRPLRTFLFPPVIVTLTNLRVYTIRL